MPTISLPRQHTRTRRFTLGRPTHLTLAPDGDTLFFLRSRSGDDPAGCLWAQDLTAPEGTPPEQRERLLADPAALVADASEELSEEELTRRERARTQGTGIVDYATDAAARLAVFALSGGLWTVDTATGRARLLPTGGAVVDPRPDPTGRRIAYAADGALRVIDADGGNDRAVASPDGPDVVLGLAEHVAAESMGRHRGYWWSPDGERLLVARVDQSAVQTWYISDPSEPAKPPRTVRYPAAGTANAEVTLWIAELDGELDGELTAVQWDRAAFEYLTEAGWDAHGPFAAVQSRDQRTVLVLGIDPADGRTSLLAEQHDDCWVQLVAGLPARTGSGALLTHADLDGVRRLAVDGSPVGPAGVNLRELLAADGEELLFLGSPTDDPTVIQLWRHRPDRGAECLTPEPGVHTGTARAGTLVLTSRFPDRPDSDTRVLRGPDATPVTVRSLAQTPQLALRQVRLATGPRRLRSQLFLPSWHRPGQGRLPVLLDPYSGPAVQKVTADQSAHSFLSQWFAEQGFAVLVTDGRGTPGRGPAWEREIYGDPYTLVLEDQVAALHSAARRHQELDLTRVGIRGWSYSGSLAALAVLRRPDVFHTAVAGAAVADQRLYDTHWRERFLGHPEEHPDRYDQASLLREAPNLTRPLLLIHGLADDNVFPANTLRLSAALLAAGRQHEVLPLTGVTHMSTDESVMENLLLHQLAFLRRTLGLKPAEDRSARG
ncbi:S9 family peptidase [Streptacidiphilus albus]|uniref:S9 family peptidase n=1 Tax=Streptacidiphilus albus TaxID=105425 RepID=UPI00054B810F|nr:prolyl oligopeptidase family serine peptidase [Streptacidiphilus albus]